MPLQIPSARPLISLVVFPHLVLAQNAPAQTRIVGTWTRAP